MCVCVCVCVYIYIYIYITIYKMEYCCCYSFTKWCRTLCDPMDYSMPGSSVLSYLLEFAQIRAH